MRRVSRASWKRLHAAASRRICQETLTEAALVTSGAAAGLMLGAAAILCGTDLRRMEELPQLTHGPRTLLVPVGHRHGYDHALRAAGASLRTVGMDEVHAHAGVRRAEVWELEAAIDAIRLASFTPTIPAPNHHYTMWSKWHAAINCRSWWMPLLNCPSQQPVGTGRQRRRFDCLQWW